jgi:ABC-type xylose transport system substrate-binding protein
VQISLRSQLIASIAALSATATVITAITPSDLTPSIQRVSSSYQLSALANPITTIAGVADQLNYQILSGQSLGNDGTTYIFADPYWTEFFTATFPSDPPTTVRYGPQTLGLI